MLSEIKLYLKNEIMIYIYAVIYILVTALPVIILEPYCDISDIVRILAETTEPFYNIGLVIIMIIIWAIFDNEKIRRMKLYWPVTLKGQMVYDYIKIAFFLIITHWSLIYYEWYWELIVTIYMMSVVMFFRYYSSSLAAALIGACVSFNGINIIIETVFMLLGINFFEVGGCTVGISSEFVLYKSIVFTIISILMIVLTFILANRRDITKGGAYYFRGVRIFVCSMISFFAYILSNGKTHFMNSYMRGLISHFAIDSAIDFELLPEERVAFVGNCIFGVSDFIWIRCIIISILVFIGAWKLTGLKGRRN